MTRERFCLNHDSLKSAAANIGIILREPLAELVSILLLSIAGLRNPFYVKDLSGYIFDYIMQSNSYVEMLLSADKYSSGKTDGKFNKEYYRLLWLKTKYITINEFNSGALSLASLIYSAWVDAGKPKIPD